MKLIEQALLVFGESRAEKVFEIDLCEVGPGRYVVNYRYGKRGSVLKDGSKTILPVPLPEARDAFEKLVQSKVDQGYVRSGVAIPGGGAAAPPPQPQAAPPTPQPTPQPAPQSTPSSTASARNFRVISPAGVDLRRQRILDRLSRGGADPVFSTPQANVRGTARFVRRARKPRPLTRWIWRAGELRLREAEPALLQQLGRGDALHNYCVIWALGRCGSDAAIEPIARLRADARTPDMVRRIASEALLQLSDDATRASFKVDLFPTLPPELRVVGFEGDPELFTVALERYLKSVTAERVGVLETLYLLDTPTVRPALLAALRDAPLKPPFFRALRHIYKAAVYRRDGEVFGLLAWRFEKVRALFRFRGRPGLPREAKRPARTAEGKSLHLSRASLGAADAPLAYSDRTRSYLRRQSWRVLRRLGQLGDPDYVKMAVGALLPYTDADAVEVRRTRSFDPRARRNVETYWDTFAPYSTFNFILYQNSPRYVLLKHTSMWRCRPTWRPGERLPSVREEAFPERWDHSPAGLLHLLAESRCLPVHQSAVRALRALPVFVATFDAEIAAMLLSRPYPVTAELGLERAIALYRPEAPDLTLLLAAIDSVFPAARAQGWRWLDAARSLIFADPHRLVSLLVGLLSSPQEDTRSRARQLALSVPLEPAVAEPVVRALLQTLMRCADPARAVDIATSLNLVFGGRMVAMGEAIVVTLLQHPVEGVQELAAQLARRFPSPSAQLIGALLGAAHPGVRRQGLGVLEGLSESLLLHYPLLVLTALTSTDAELRAGGRPILRRLLALDPLAGTNLVIGLAELLLKGGLGDGVPAAVVALFRAELEPFAAAVPEELMWRLIRSKSATSQELGGFLLGAFGDASGLQLDALALLGSHEVLSVRQGCWAIYRRSVPRLKQDMAGALRLVDAKWADTRDFAFRFFLDNFSPEDFSPEVLITVCDSVREDVQKFGQQLLNRCFRTEEGPYYLMRLAEHPGVSMQLFVTHYLDGYGGDQLATLEPYLIMVLSRPNKGGLARKRVLAFLERQAQDPRAAPVVARILSRVSATIAVQTRASAIRTLVELHRAHPDVPVPFTPVVYPSRS